MKCIKMARRMSGAHCTPRSHTSKESPRTTIRIVVCFPMANAREREMLPFICAKCEFSTRTKSEHMPWIPAKKFIFFFAYFGSFLWRSYVFGNSNTLKCVASRRKGGADWRFIQRWTTRIENDGNRSR